MILFLSNKDDYDEEINNLKNAIREYANRIDFRAAVVYDIQLIKQYRQKTPWFGPDQSYSSIILKRYDDNVSYMTNIGPSIFNNNFMKNWISK